MKIKTVIIDDERLARQELKSLLENHKEIEIIAEFKNADEAIARLDEIDPELIFLDIQMPGKDGFQLLEEIDLVPKVVFVTAYDEYALKAFEVNALDYLLKPVEDDRLNEAITKIKTEIEEERAQKSNNERLNENEQIFLKDGEKCWFVQLSNIRFFESEGNYVRVFFDENRPLILKSLNKLEGKLDEKVFFRANRKHIINLKWVEKIEPWFNGGLLATMKDENKIEISRRQAVRLKERMTL